jgi:hypothetical protein
MKNKGAENGRVFRAHVSPLRTGSLQVSFPVPPQLPVNSSAAPSRAAPETSETVGCAGYICTPEMATSELPLVFAGV